MTQRVLDPIEFEATSDGQRYSALFEKPLDQSPNHCEVFIGNHQVGEATWYGLDEGLLDRFPNGTPVRAWNEVCDRIEREVDYRLQGMKRAAQVPLFRTARDQVLRYSNGEWKGVSGHPPLIYGAAVCTGFPTDADGTTVEGTFINHPRE